MAAQTQQLAWEWRGRSISVGIERRGTGPAMLILPALSSISTRGEMRPLQERLSARFSTVAIDWPGFGDQPRPAIAWQPDTYRAFLADLSTGIVRPAVTLAAGHAAGYVLAQAAEAPGSLGRLCLIAPTWRGPLPTMMGKRHRIFDRLIRAIDLPVIGPALYRLNVNRIVVRMMARGHVYADREWLTPERLSEKLAVINAPGARHSSFRFVTGGLDPATSRTSFLEAAGRVSDPILMVHGAATPRKSLAEMEALAALPNVRAIKLPVGKLAVHEEFPGLVAEAVQSFLASVGLEP